MSRKQKLKNESTTEHIYDVVIVGAGQTGMTLAKTLMRRQIHVLLIDEQEPGIKSSIDIKLFSILANKYKGTEPKNFLSLFPNELEKLKLIANKSFDQNIFIDSTVRFVKGRPRILSSEQIEVNDENFKFKKLVFANGSHYEELSLPGIEKEMYINPTEISKLTSSIEIVAIYGSDWVALELGQALTKIGVKVYFVDSNINPFNDFDDEIESVLRKQFKNNLMDWCLESTVINHQYVSDNVIKISLKTDSQEYDIEVNKIISTNNRVSNTGNIESFSELHKNKKQSFIIDASFRMKYHRNFYAIGDVNGIHMNPNQGSQQAFLLAQNFLGARNVLDIYDFTFSINIEPSISFYGMNKIQIEHSQIPYNEFIYEFRDDYKTNINNQLGRIKVFTNKKHEILGVLLIGDKLSELISLFIMAKQNKTKFHKLAWLNFPFFSKAESIKLASLEYYYEFILDESKLNKDKNIFKHYFATKRQK